MHTMSGSECFLAVMARLTSRPDRLLRGSGEPDALCQYR